MTSPSLTSPSTRPGAFVPRTAEEAHARRRQMLALSALMLMLVLAALDQTILSTALPFMARDLPGSLPPAWTFSAYLLSATVVIALYGRLADVYGRKPMLLLSVGLFLLGSLACAASQTMLQLVLARALQGAGGGGLMTLTMLTVAALFPLQERGRYQALLGAVYGVATMFGPLTGGWLTEHFSWRWAFGLNVPLAVVAFAVLGMTLPRRHAGEPGRAAPRTPVDLAGALLLTGALCSTLLMTQIERLGLPAWMSAWVLGGLCALCTALFMLRQRLASHPLVPLSLFARPAYAAVSLIGLATGVALYAGVVFMPAYLQNALHLAPTAAAWHLLPLMAGVTVAAIASGRLLRAQVAARRLAGAATALVTVAFALLALAMELAPQRPVVLSACLLPLGVGLGLLFPVITVVSQRVSPANLMGIATAIPVMLRSVGGAVGVALLTALLSRVLHSGLASHGAATGAVGTLALQAVWGCSAGVSVLAMLACRWLPAAPLALPAPSDAADTRPLHTQGAPGSLARQA